MYSDLQSVIRVEYMQLHLTKNAGIKPYMKLGTSWVGQNLAEELLLPHTYGIEHSSLRISQGISLEVSTHCLQLHC